MVKSNKSVVFIKHVEGPVTARTHVDVQHKDINTQLGEGDILLRNLYVSLDPYLRGRMVGLKDSYVPSFEISDAFDSYGISEVIETKNPKFPVGTLVTGPFTRWEEYTVLPTSSSSTLVILPEAVRNSKIPLSAYIGVLGMPGFTAYGGLLDIGQPKAGETIYISAASGAVGQLVGQIAKLKGLRVIGSAGSDDKVEFLLKELKFDVAFNYKKGKIVDSLRAAAPEGIDIYYDNVGGESLEAALHVLRLHGRVIVCGMVSGYNTDDTYHVKNLVLISSKRLTIKGFLVLEFSQELQQRFNKDVTGWFLNGDIVYKEDITNGLDDAPEAFVGLFDGKNFGKALVKIADL
ncbi:hypothetical protein BGZ76_002816 [Entomortierella beljakovae]|nr:hypothetical protein BGZ76_002816 [Entomortierella beljakovae]